MARAAASGLEQPIQVGASTLGDKFDRAVVAVPDPASEPQRAGLAREEVAEPDSLDVTADDAMKAFVLHDWYIVPEWPPRP